jgi:poly(3-hydroxybutyrate) depolymerase
VSADHGDPWQPLVTSWLDREARLIDLSSGSSHDQPVLSHLDLRADNIVLTDAPADQDVWFVDWAHPGLAACWVDLALLLADVVGSGADASTGGPIDVMDVWRRHRIGSQCDPELLIAAPMSGHFATLLRGTVERLLPRHDVYITDWKDAKLVPLSAGSFDLDDYVDYLIEFLEAIGEAGGERPHMLAVCQPAPAAFAATALMAKNRWRPKTLTMMGGPIDTREAPTAINTLATQRPHNWFENNVVATVPMIYPGAGRQVYPGFLQLAGFMTMNLGDHLISHWEMFKHLVEGDEESADATRAFYEEYRSVSDMSAEFYLQTVDVVFQRHLLPDGKYVHRGTRVDPAAIRDTALLAIEGERDDISGIGQTKAALDIAKRVPAAKKKYFRAKDVGHYGIFNGRKWREKIAPVVEKCIAEHR